MNQEVSLTTIDQEKVKKSYESTIELIEDSIIPSFSSKHDNLKPLLSRYGDNKQSKVYFSQIKEKIKSIYDKYLELTEIANNNKEEIKEKQNWDRLVEWLKEGRTYRNLLDGDRKKDKSTVSSINDTIENFYSSFIDFIALMETDLKKVRHDIEEEEERERKRKKEEAEKKYMQRIQELNIAGFVILDGYYTLQNPDNPEDAITLQTIDIRSTTDELWSTISERAAVIKKQIDDKKEQEKKEKEEAENKLKKQQAELQEQQENLIKERYENRKEVLLNIGLTINENTGDFYFEDNLVIKKENVVVEAFEEWKSNLDLAKLEINRLNVRKIIQSNYSRLYNLGFKKHEENMVFTGGTHFEIKQSDLGNTELISNKISEFEKQKQAHEIEAKRINDLLFERSNILLNAGMKYDYRAKKCTYNLLIPEEGGVNQIEVEDSKLVSYTVEQFNSELEKIKLAISEDVKRHNLFLENKKKEDDQKLIDVQTDNSKIDMLLSDLNKLFEKYSFKNENTQKQYLGIIEDATIKIGNLHKN